jgi:transcriptional regulator with XRE-family HTH domain
MSQLADGKLSRTAIHLIETGRSRPSEQTLAHISDRTGKPVAYFLGAIAPDARRPWGEMSRRSVDLMRQASWSLTDLLKAGDLSGPERIALEALLVNLRNGMRLVEALDPKDEPGSD